MSEAEQCKPERVLALWGIVKGGVSWRMPPQAFKQAGKIAHPQSKFIREEDTNHCPTGLQEEEMGERDGVSCKEPAAWC